MFTYSFLNNTDAPISIKTKDASIVIPAKGSYVIKVGESCPIQYKVELHRAKKIFTSGSDFILTLRKIHDMIKSVLYEYEVVEPRVEVKEPEPSKSEDVHPEVPEVAEEVGVVKEAEVSEDMATLKILDFNPVMTVGKQEKILVQVDGDGRSVNFKTTDKTVATVSRFGNVYPQKPGNAEIHVTFNGVTKILKLEVLPAEEVTEEEE